MSLRTSVELILVQSVEQKLCVKEIIENHHSYVASNKSVGRRIDWLILLSGCIVGMIGLGSATYPPCKDLLAYLGVTKTEYQGRFNTIANNWRFCLTETVPNLGTVVLSKLREQAPIAWKNKYGDNLNYLMTFVGGGHTGAVYKADNWNMIGFTAGLPKHKSSSMKWNNAKELKELFVKPTGQDKKLIFVKNLGLSCPKEKGE